MFLMYIPVTFYRFMYFKIFLFLMVLKILEYNDLVLNISLYKWQATKKKRLFNLNLFAL